MNLIDAAIATVHDYLGGSESLGPRMGLSGAVLRNKLDPRNDAQQLTVAEADRIMTLTGDFRMLRALAHQHGFLVVESPDPDASGPEMEVLEQGFGSRGGNSERKPGPHGPPVAGNRIDEKERCATRAAERALQAMVAKMAQRKITPQREGLADRAGWTNAGAGSSSTRDRSGQAFSCEREAGMQPLRQTGCP